MGNLLWNFYIDAFLNLADDRTTSHIWTEIVNPSNISLEFRNDEKHCCNCKEAVLYSDILYKNT